MREEPGVPIGIARAIFQVVRVRDEELKPLLHVLAVFSDLFKAVECLMVKPIVEKGARQMTMKTLDDPSAAAHFHIERGPVALTHCN